jgi:hypothetical protein
VQIFIIPVPPKRPTGQYLTVGLYESYSTPPGSRLEVDEIRKQVEIGESPAILRFKLVCESNTKPAEIAFTANIDGAPDGFEIARTDPPENGTIKIRVK